jgi:hypothetical protein
MGGVLRLMICLLLEMKGCSACRTVIDQDARTKLPCPE